MDAKEVAVIGNGNVALDVARMLIKLPDDLASTEIPPHVERGLRESKITDVLFELRTYKKTINNIFYPSYTTRPS